MTAFQLAKKMIDIFVNSKHIMNPLHRFAVIGLYDGASWVGITRKLVIISFLLLLLKIKSSIVLIYQK